MATSNEIYRNADCIENKDKYIVSQMDFNYLIRMTSALEKINEVKKLWEDGEIDGWDFSEEVEEILNRV